MQGDKALYVGVGTVGAMSRCFSAQHHRRKALEDADHVDIYLCRTKYEAMALETQLIRELKPTANHIQPQDKARLIAIFQQRKSGATYLEIAEAFGITPQRAHQLAARARQFPYGELLESPPQPNVDAK